MGWLQASVLLVCICALVLDVVTEFASVHVLSELICADDLLCLKQLRDSGVNVEN